MNRKRNLFKTLGLALILVFSFSTYSFANSIVDDSMTFAEAKEYLTTYSKTEINEFGEEFTIGFEFDTEEELNDVATYIVENGLAEFNRKIESTMESENDGIQPRATMPAPILMNKFVKGNGTHLISGQAGGTASFSSLGKVEYLATMSFKAVVRNNKVTDIKDISFGISGFSTGGSWENVSFQKTLGTGSGGLTASYTIKKSVELPIGPGVTIKTETSQQSMGIFVIVS